MKSVLIVQKDEQLIIRRLAQELLEVKEMTGRLKQTCDELCKVTQEIVDAKPRMKDLMRFYKPLST